MTGEDWLAVGATLMVVGYMISILWPKAKVQKEDDEI